MQRKSIDTDARSSLIRTDDQRNEEQGTDKETQSGEIQDVYVLIVREWEETQATPFVVASTPVPSQKASLVPAYAICSIYLFCVFAPLAFQLYCISNPEIATITIVPKTKQVTLSGTVQLGRLLSPITISESQTVPTTGRGHQDAQAAWGTVTFYNGQQTSQTIAQGTVFTGQSGVSIETTQQATIPPGNPGTGFGTVTVTAQALHVGSAGNIQAGDINTPIALAVFVRNNRFSGGQNARSYTTVTQVDIHSLSTVLKTRLAQSITGALQGQLQPVERMILLPCLLHLTSNHQVGEEATAVTVAISQTCSAVAYHSQELARKATTLLATQARQKTGTGYSLFGTVHVSVKQASVSSTTPHLVFLSFQAQGTWVYALSSIAQQIKQLIAGKTTQEAMQLLAALPGIEQATIRFSGFGDETRLPKATGYLHLAIIVV